MEISIERLIDIASLSKNVSVIFEKCDDTLTLKFVSEGVPALFGYSYDETKKYENINVYSYLSESDCSNLSQQLNECLLTHNPFDLSVRVPHKIGELVLFCGRSNYICSQDNLHYFYCILSDEAGKTNKNKTYNLLLENEKKYIEAIDFANIHTWDLDLLTDRISNYATNNPLPKEALFFNNYPMDLISNGVLDPKDISTILDAVTMLKEGAPIVTFENWYHFPGIKQPKYLRIKYINEFDINGKPIIAHGMSIDLSEQKNAEVAFERRTNAVLRMNPDSVAAIQINLTDNSCSPASASHSTFSQLLKCRTVDELITSCLSFINDKNDQIHFINTFSRSSILSSFNAGILQIKLDHHMRMRNKNDEWVRTVVDIVKNPLTGDVEAVLHMINIHHHKVIDSLINGTVQREFDFIALIRVKSDSYILIDRFNQIFNEEKSHFIEDFKEKFANIIQSPQELNRVYESFTLQNIIEKINLLGEYTLQFNSSDDPEKNHHRILRFSFLNSKRDIITLSCRDTTKLYNEEQARQKELSDALDEAEKANKAKSEFLSLVSHDIRTPLNGIMGMMQLAIKETSLPKIRNYLEKAEMSSKFLLGLINDLLDMSKIESGKVELRPELYPYEEFVDYINSVIRPLCKKKNLHFSVYGNDMVPYAFVDKLRFNQIMFNLLSNACKYTKEGGAVTLKMVNEKVSDTLCIGTFIIKDTGIGISEEFQEHLFETFSQENRMSFNHNEGTGLGLSITHSLVELMGGEITVNSEMDKGTTFTVQLTYPYFESIEEEAVSAEVKETKNTKTDNDYTDYIFLLCEDNIINQEIACELLSSFGAKVEVAENGQEGIDKFLSSDVNYYSAIFMDIRMPVMDGLSASKAIRELDRPDATTIPIIAMTANAMSEDRMECIEAGMNSFVAKPINVTELLDTMKATIKND